MVIRTSRYYRGFKIKKPSGGNREIWAPRVFLKTVQRYVLDCMLAPIVPHEAATGFRRDIGIRDGAQRHVGRPFLWNIDLKDFFPSINQSQVTGLFSQLGFPHQASYFLSGLCCLRGKLPQGAPTSPAIANLILFPTDTEIGTLARRNRIIYTRYADDLTFSGTHPISDEFRREVGVLIESAGFRINKSKSRLMGPRCRREVTGLVVNRKVSIPRETRRKLRARFHRVSVHPERFTKQKGKLLGYASWVSQYRPKEGHRYRAIAEAIPSE